MILLDKYRIPCYSPEDGTGSAGSTPTPASTTPSTPPSGGETPASSSPTSPPAPAAQPSGEPRPTPQASDSSGGEAFDFSAIFEHTGEPEVPPEVRPEPPKPAKPPKAPEPPPTAAQTKPEVAAQPEAVVPRTPEPATPQAQAAQPQTLDRYNPEVLANHLARNEAQALEYVANNVFKLTPEEVEALETNVVETVPKLLAKVFVKSQQNVLSQLAQMVPVMIQRQTVAIQKNAEGADKFYQRWPMIKKEQHGELVMRYGAVYRQMHQEADLNQMIEDLGPMVMMAARIAPPVAAQPPTGQPVNPAAQRAVGNGRPPPPSPFVPAGSVGPAASTTAPEMSPWEAMFRHEE